MALAPFDFEGVDNWRIGVITREELGSETTEFTAVGVECCGTKDGGGIEDEGVFRGDASVLEKVLLKLSVGFCEDGSADWRPLVFATGRKRVPPFSIKFVG